MGNVNTSNLSSSPPPHPVLRRYPTVQQLRRAYDDKWFGWTFIEGRARHINGTWMFRFGCTAWYFQYINGRRIWTQKYIHTTYVDTMI